MHIHVCTYVCVYVLRGQIRREQTNLHKYMCICIYVYIYIHIHISCRSGVSKQTCGCAKHQHAATAPFGLCVQAAMVHSLCMSHHHTYYVTSSYILCVQAAMVCVCGCEKEREKERERGREKEGKRERVCVCAAKGRAPKRLTHESSRLVVRT